MTPAEAASLPSFRKFLGLCVPLAFTFLLMTGSAPIVNAGITRMAEPGEEDTEVGGFAIAFAVALFLHSPTFSIRDVALKVIGGRSSLRRVHLVWGALALAVAGLDVLAALTPLGVFLFTRIMGATDTIVARAQPALLIFAPMPLLIVWRGIYQAVHVGQDRARLLGYGTAIRMVVMAIIAIGLGPYLGLPGASLGALAFTMGILVEAVLSAAWARGYPALRADDAGRAPRIAELVRLASPLWIAGYLQVIVMPLIFRVINEMADAPDNIATMEVVKSLVWFLTSTAFSFQIVTIAWVKSPRHLVAVVRFALVVVGGLCGLLVLLALPPVRDLILVHAMKIDRESIRALAAHALWIGVPFPLIVGARSVLRGLVIVTGRTVWVTLATLLAFAPFVVLLVGGWYLRRPGGALLGTGLWLGGSLLETLLLLGAMVWAGLWRRFAASPASA
ncbi:MAG: hypothetical protein AB1486_12595 [Planctomycetota bacterium]